MSIKYFENSVLIDEWVVSFANVPQAADKVYVLNRIKKNWDGVKSDLEGLSGIKLVKPDLEAVADALIKAGTHAVMFELVLTKAEFRLDVVISNVTFKAGKVAVPGELEAYRSFLSNLNGWSTAERNIVPDSDFKSFNENNPKVPPKPTKHSNFEEMVKKSKNDLAAFRTWSNTNSNAKKAFADIDKTAKLKPTDPARAAALKSIDAYLVVYYKSF